MDNDEFTNWLNIVKDHFAEVRPPLFPGEERLVRFLLGEGIEPGVVISIIETFRLDDKWKKIKENTEAVESIISAITSKLDRWKEINDDRENKSKVAELVRELKEKLSGLLPEPDDDNGSGPSYS